MGGSNVPPGEVDGEAEGRGIQAYNRLRNRLQGRIVAARPVERPRATTVRDADQVHEEENE